MNNNHGNDKSKTPQTTPQAGKASVQEGKDARPSSDTRSPSEQAAGKDAKGTASPSKS